MTKKRKNILIAASEAVPFVKSGGLGDVCGALPKALRDRGHDVRLVLPRYWSIDLRKHETTKAVSPMGVQMGDRILWCSVLETKFRGVTVYFIEHEHYFGRAGLYDDKEQEYHDNAERFAFFSRAALQLCMDIGFRPDIIHCNDWQTALIPAYLKTWEKNNLFFSSTASVFTIHNIGHQGVFHPRHLPFVGLWEEDFHQDRFESFGYLNFMKGAIFYADKISTVSPTYAQEILTDIGGNGIGEYLERRKDDLIGILNGADYDHWSPETDDMISANYSTKDLSGKNECKKALQRAFLLKEDATVPVIGVVARFAEQKGLQHLVPAMREILSEMRVQFVFLGCGDKNLEDFFGGLPARYPGKVGSWIGYSNEKAHMIEAGSDLFLMPSLYEPCGLNQIYSMKYGTLPIVREIGGLKDTVKKYNEDTGRGTGFSFYSTNPLAIKNTIGWAVSTYYDRPGHFKKMQLEAMNEHFTWDDSSVEYEQLYEDALLRRKDRK